LMFSTSGRNEQQHSNHCTATLQKVPESC
jgi:hypothetical protein